MTFLPEPFAGHPPIEMLGRMPGGVVCRDLETHPTTRQCRACSSSGRWPPCTSANAPRVRRRVLGVVDAATPRPEVLVVDFIAVPDIDITALDELPAFDANVRERGIKL